MEFAHQLPDKLPPSFLDYYKQDLCPYQAEVLYECVGVAENQLTIKKGEIIIVLDNSEVLNGWALFLMLTGLVLNNYLKAIVDAEWRESEQFKKAQEIKANALKQDLLRSWVMV